MPTFPIPFPVPQQTALGGTVPVPNQLPSPILNQILNAQAGGAPNFIAGPQGVAKAGLPAVAPSPGLPMVQQTPGLPATIPGPQYSPNFTLGASGPTISPSAEGLRNPYNPSRVPVVQPPLAPASGPAGDLGLPKLAAQTPGAPGMFSRVGKATKALTPYALAIMGANAVADVVGDEPAPDSNVRSQFPIGQAYNLGQKLETDINAGEFPGLVASALDPLAQSLQRPAQVIEGFGNLFDDAGNYIYEAAFVPQKDIRAKREAELQSGSAEVRKEAAGVDAGLMEKLLLGMDESYSPINLGPARQDFGEYALPAPPGPADYSGVQEAVDKTKPEDINSKVEERRKGAILAGLLGGLLAGALDSDANYGTVLGRAGLGVLQGMSIGDQYEDEARAKFKNAMDEYWIRTAGVRQNQAESQNDYINRVYATKLKQMEINAEAAAARAKAGESKIYQQGGMFFIDTVTDTPQGKQRQLIPFDPSKTTRMGGMIKTVEEMLGGTDEAKKKAAAIVAESVSRQNPAYALPMITVARMKANGTYLDFVKELGESDPDFKKAFNSIGVELSGVSGVDEKQLNKLAENRRDAVIIDLLLKSDNLRARAYNFAGLGGVGE